MEGVDAREGGYAAKRGTGGRWEIRRLDGSSFFVVNPPKDLEEALERIARGEPAEEEIASRLEVEGAFESCMGAARALCARAEQSSGGLARKLAAKGYDVVAVRRAIAALMQAGLVNDARFARAWITSRDGKAEGPRSIEAGLIARGVPHDIARDAARAIDDEGLSRRLVAARRKYLSKGYEGALLRERLRAEGCSNMAIREVMDDGNA